MPKTARRAVPSSALTKAPLKQLTAQLTKPLAKPLTPNRRIQVRQSGVHGKGVFALMDIAEGERVVEYKGELIDWQEALRRHPHDPSDPNHTFFFHIDEERVIDGKVNGNSAKWINHSCGANCEADEDGVRVFIKAIRNIAAGEELNYDYGLIIDEKYTAKLKKEFACWCGSPECRGTMLAPKDKPKSKAVKKKAEKKAKIKTKEKAEKKAKKMKKANKADKANKAA